MTLSNPTWAVVATVDEPPTIVKAFVAWHLSLGAEQVFVYCDYGADPLVQVLNAVPGVTAVACDQIYWETRPERIEERQVHNARDAYARCDADWLVHLDADEFLCAPQPVAQTLKDAAPDADGLVVPVAERVHLADDPGRSVFEGAFRRPYNGTNKDGRTLFGRAYHLTYKGLTSHAQGKAFIRTGRRLWPSIHRAKCALDGTDAVHQRIPTHQLELLHFEGLTPRHWARKLSRQLSQPNPPGQRHRQRQQEVFNKEGEGLYQRLKMLDSDVVLALRDHGLLLEADFDPSAAIASVFGGKVDLRPAAVNAWVGQVDATGLD